MTPGATTRMLPRRSSRARSTWSSRIRTPRLRSVGSRAYEKWASHIHHLTRKLGRPDVHKTTPYDEDSAQRLIAGSPRTVLEKLQEMLRLTGANYLLCVFSFGDLAPEDALRSLELFSSEVRPGLSRSS